MEGSWATWGSSGVNQRLILEGVRAIRFSRVVWISFLEIPAQSGQNPDLGSGAFGGPFVWYILRKRGANAPYNYSASFWISNFWN